MFKGEHMKVFKIAIIFILSIEYKLIAFFANIFSYLKTTVSQIVRVYGLVNANTYNIYIKALLT